jgi:hypothetical protein
MSSIRTRQTIVMFSKNQIADAKYYTSVLRVPVHTYIGVPHCDGR